MGHGKQKVALSLQTKNVTLHPAIQPRNTPKQQASKHNSLAQHHGM
jgi:hypothetical protein